MNRKYEVLLLINPNMDDDSKSKLIEEVESKFTGEIVKKEDWGIKETAYPIKKQDKAHYILWYVETPSSDIKALKEMIAIDTNVLRPMILKHEKDFPFNLKTSKDIKFPERKQRKPRPTTSEKQESKEPTKTLNRRAAAPVTSEIEVVVKEEENKEEES